MIITKVEKLHQFGQFNYCQLCDFGRNDSENIDSRNCVAVCIC